MGNRQPPKPTEGELEILKVLWERQGGTVRDVYESLSRRRPTGYTTVLKLLQIMTEKGLVVRDEEQRAHVYRAKMRQEQTQRQLLGDLLDRLFNGSPSQLVMQALSSKRTSPAELARIREMLDQIDGKGENRDA
jgi:BlaI family penicillinase repressor